MVKYRREFLDVLLRESDTRADRVGRLRKLWESLELEILGVLEATNRLRARREFELLGLTAKEPALFDRVVAKHTAQLEKEIAGLTSEAEKLAAEIAELTSQAALG